MSDVSDEQTAVLDLIPDWVNLKTLLTNEDPHHVQQGLELVKSLDAEAIAALTEGMSLSETGEIEPCVHVSRYGHTMAQLGLFLANPGRCEGITSLDLTCKRLEGFPHDLKSLRGLRELILNDNRLDHWPSGLRDLSALEVLDLSRNHIEEIPDELGDLTQLTSLNLALNRKIRSLPTAVGRLQSLERLYLGYNSLPDLPEELKSLQSLRHLSLAYNKFTQLPSWLGELTGLESLNVTGNPRVTELPPSMGELPNLRRIFAGHGNYDEIVDSTRRLFEGQEKIVSWDAGPSGGDDAVIVDGARFTAADLPAFRAKLQELMDEAGVVNVVRAGWRR